MLDIETISIFHIINNCNELCIYTFTTLHTRMIAPL